MSLQVYRNSKILGDISNPLKKLRNNMFGGAKDLIMIKLILIRQNIINKPLSGHFLGHPPKLHILVYTFILCRFLWCSTLLEEE